MYVASLIPNH